MGPIILNWNNDLIGTGAPIWTLGKPKKKRHNTSRLKLRLTQVDIFSCSQIFYYVQRGLPMIKSPHTLPTLIPPLYEIGRHSASLSSNLYLPLECILEKGMVKILLNFETINSRIQVIWWLCILTNSIPWLNPSQTTGIWYASRWVQTLSTPVDTTTSAMSVVVQMRPNILL